MNEEDDFLPMDSGPERPELVSEPTIREDVTDHPEAEADPEKSDQPRGADGKFASKDTGDKPADEAEPVTPTDKPIPDDQFKGYLTEKRKRQELEQQVAALQQQMAQPRPQQAPPPDFWENPDAAMQQRLDQFGEQLLERFQQRQQAERIDASEAAAKGRHTDYEDARRAFHQAAMANPSLVQQMTNASDPAEFAYQRGKTALALESVGSVDELRAQIRAELEAEVKAAMPAPKLSFPTSTVLDGSAAPRGGPVWTGPTQDRDILPMG